MRYLVFCFVFLFATPVFCQEPFAVGKWQGTMGPVQGRCAGVPKKKVVEVSYSYSISPRSTPGVTVEGQIQPRVQQYKKKTVQVEDPPGSGIFVTRDRWQWEDIKIGMWIDESGSGVLTEATSPAASTVYVRMRLMYRSPIANQPAGQGWSHPQEVKASQGIQLTCKLLGSSTDSNPMGN